MVGIPLNCYDILLGEDFELPISRKKDLEHPIVLLLYQGFLISKSRSCVCGPSIKRVLLQMVVAYASDCLKSLFRSHGPVYSVSD
ncbi:hypothetical protein MTR67_042397 [Solanum verrucosum]|uniref:Uncharacterized protein n=1 Tax=Solanum verrucosum TaxID=315347 RepID=A0AAF0UMG9_SOLVR|nr:hypothetical protein MTR67_042397 [Solanum verrucosum]